MQYSLANLNAFLLLIIIGIFLYNYSTPLSQTRGQAAFESGSSYSLNIKKVNTNVGPSASEIEANSANLASASSLHISETSGSDLADNLYDEAQLVEKNYSPIQLINQLKGLFGVNPYISLSLAITLFSFAGVPPLVGFFAKQMVLSSAIDNGYIFLTFIAILTSVVSAYYYLVIVKQMFFNRTDYKFYSEELNRNSSNSNLNSDSNSNPGFKRSYWSTLLLEKLEIKSLSSVVTLPISFITLIITIFILIPNEWLNMVNILTLILFSK